MGCCVEIEEKEIHINRGQSHRYSILSPAQSSSQWVLINKDQLKNVIVSQLGGPRISDVGNEHKVKRMLMDIKGIKPGEEIIQLVQYKNGTTNIKKIQTLKVIIT